MKQATNLLKFFNKETSEDETKKTEDLKRKTSGKSNEPVAFKDKMRAMKPKKEKKPEKRMEKKPEKRTVIPAKKKKMRSIRTQLIGMYCVPIAFILILYSF